MATLAIDLEQRRSDQNVNDLPVQEHLAEVLASSTFSRTPRLRQFLSFVVEQTLAGEQDGIKEYLIATTVYGRSDDYDPQVDSTVRVEASRLRSRLREYYDSEGLGCALEIQLPKGSYVPVFVPRQEQAVDGGNFDEQCDVSTPAERPTFGQRGLAWCGLLVAILSGALLWTAGPRARADDAVETAVLDRELLERYLRAQKLLRTPVMQNGWPGRVPPTVLESISLFREVTTKAPNYTPAWVALGEAHEWAYELDPQHPQSRVEAAKQALQHALSLSANSADAWSRLGSVYFHQLADLEHAETAVRKAIANNPRDVASHRRLSDLLRIRGRFEDALQAVKAALAVDPASPRLWAQRAIILYDLSRYDEAIVFADHALGLSGGKQQPLAWWVKGLAVERLGRQEEAEAIYREGMRSCKDEIHNRSSLAHLLASTGREREAQAMLNEFLGAQKAGQNVGYQIAVIYAGLGRSDDALTWLQRAKSNRETNAWFTGLEKRFEKLKEHPRFRALVREGPAGSASELSA